MIDDLLKIVERDPNWKADPETMKKTKAYADFMLKLKAEGKLSEYLAEIRKMEEELQDDLDVFLK